MPELYAPWRIGVDIGGTFTDLVVAGGRGSVYVRKLPSTPADPSEGVLQALQAAAAELGMSVNALLGGCSHFVHGSTIATNIILEHKGARVGMLVSEGFRDSLEIRRGIRRNAWDHRTPFQPVLVPRYLRCPVRGRLDRHGAEVVALSLADVEEAARLFREEGVEAVAICLFNSFLDERHEVAAAAVCRRLLPEAAISLSSRVAPIIGEYERSSTAVLNCYVAPRVVSYVSRLESTLRERGLGRPLLMVQNNGGTITAEKVMERPVSLLLSGPAAGVGALAFIGALAGTADLVAMEIGGTSCDVTLLVDGEPELASEFDIGGYHAALSSVGIHSIGAGGGTIAGTDRAGMIFVGPRGAGADPGPASYGRGGVEPTATDAQLILGRLRPGPLGFGECALDLARAREAIAERLARPLGLSVEAAAAGVICLLEQQLFQAVQRVTGERGHDPRRFMLVAAGGAGPMHGHSIARKLGSPAVYIPRLAGAFCALGMLNAPVRHEYARVYLALLGESTAAAISGRLIELVDEARGQLARDGFAADETEILFELELRYPGQVGTLRVPAGLGAAFDWAAVGEHFTHLHERYYGHRQDAPVEIAALRVSGIGRLPPLEMAAGGARGSAAEPNEVREVYFEEAGGFVPTSVYIGAALAPGAQLQGPAIIEELTTTVVVGPGAALEVDRSGNFIIRILVLLRHKHLRLRRRGVRGRFAVGMPQHGHRDRLLTRATISRRRKVA
ncbi:MAG: hydantoinase/oxoprolinase family protein, partial [Alphaproteobacteria bacterium]